MAVTVEEAELIREARQKLRQSLASFAAKATVDYAQKVLQNGQVWNYLEASGEGRGGVSGSFGRSEISVLAHGGFIHGRPSLFGAFVQILPGQDGLVHISELAPYRVNKVEDVVRLGDTILVKVIKIDNYGKISLSLKDTKR